MRSIFGTRLRSQAVIVVAVVLSVGLLAGSATASAPVFVASDGDCINPSATRTISQSGDLYLAIDWGRSRLTEGNVIWQLVNLDTGLVQLDDNTTAALYDLTCGDPTKLYLLYDTTSSGPISASQLTGAKYILHLEDTTNGATKNLRFSTVP